MTAADHRKSNRGYDDSIGWTALPGFLSDDEVSEALAVCADLLELPAGERHARDKPFAGTVHLAELDDRSVFIAAVVNRPALQAVVAEILGPSHRRDDIGYRSPKPTFGGQKLHADDVPKLTDGPAQVATAVIALTAFTASNGSTRIVPGSHLRPDLQRKSGSLDVHPDEVMLTGDPGTAFVFSGHALHSGTVNRSTEPRPALHLVWRAGPRDQKVSRVLRGTE